MTTGPFARLLIPNVRGLPRAFWLLFTAALIDRLGGFAHVYLAIYLTKAGNLSLSLAGLVISMLALGGLAGAPVGGALADRFGRKPLLVGGMLITAASWIHVAYARGPTHIGVAVLLSGVASSLARPAMVAAIGDVVPASDRRRAFGLHYWAANLGFAFAASVAGLLADVSWTLVFLIDAVTSVLAAGLLFLAMRNAPPPSAEERTSASLAEILRGPAKDPVFRLLVLVGLVNAATFQQASVSLAEEMRRDGLVTEYGPLLAINGALIVLLQPTLTQVTARVRATWVLGAGSLLVGLGFFAVGFSDAWWQHAAAIVVWTIGEILLASTMPAVITRLSPPDRRATYQGLYQLSWSVAAFSPAAGALLIQHAGGRALWSLCLVGGLVGVLVQVRLDRSRRMTFDDGS